MIAFYSPEGRTFRTLRPSRSAIEAIWFNAVQDGRDDWVAWAREELTNHLTAADLAAMSFVQAASDGEVRRAQQLWSILGTFPVEERESRFFRAARDLRASLPF